MLPIIDLRLADYCRVAFNYCLGLSLPIGHSLWFDREEAVWAGKGLPLNLDEYLTALLASCFAREGAQARILGCWAGPAVNLFKVLRRCT